MFSTLKKTILSRLKRNKSARESFVQSHLNKTVAYQIRALRDRDDISQEALAATVGMNQNAISRLESPEYGKHTITTLRRLAAAFDVGLVVRFVPFSEMADWASGTPYVNIGLNPQALSVPSFEAEVVDGVFKEPVQLTSIIAATEEKYQMNTFNAGAVPIEVRPQSERSEWLPSCVYACAPDYHENQILNGRLTQ
jgi:transcriptional regulator with XRE-family HTH domain